MGIVWATGRMETYSKKHEITFLYQILLRVLFSVILSSIVPFREKEKWTHRLIFCTTVIVTSIGRICQTVLLIIVILQCDEFALFYKFWFLSVIELYFT